jgi:hypothetical protein
VEPAISTVAASPNAPKNPLTEAVVQAEEDVADAPRADPPFPLAHHHRVLVLELVLEDLVDGAAERPALVAAPDGEVLAHAVDLDRLEDEVDRRRAEEAAHADQEGELQAAAEVELRRGQVEEVLPELDVPCLDRDQLVERPPEVAARGVAQRRVQREVEHLVEDEPARELRVGRHQLPGTGSTMCRPVLARSTR